MFFEGDFPAALLTKSSASPTLILLAVPSIQVLVSEGESCHGRAVCAGNAFHAMTAVRSADVSKTCGVCPGPGMLCTRVPAGMSTLSGDPGALLSVKARMSEAATPREGTYPTRRASSKTERWSTAVRSHASFADRS